MRTGSPITEDRGLQRSVDGLSAPYHTRVVERYNQILPLLFMLLRPRDIYERNRAWPGVRPPGKAATTYLSPQESWRARDVISAYAVQGQEDADVLWTFFAAYCQYGPIGLIDALTTDDDAFAPREIHAYARFLRVGKHPRSDPGIYVRELINTYADMRGIPRLPTFLSRYVFASQRLLDRWFFPEQHQTADQPKVTRRLNRTQSYPHHTWTYWAAPLPFPCVLHQEDSTCVVPWLCGFSDVASGTHMDIQVSLGVPTAAVFGIGLRQAIWHCGCTWWPARGIPDHIVVPPALLNSCRRFATPLLLMHCDLHAQDYGENAQAYGIDVQTPWFTQMVDALTLRELGTITQLQHRLAAYVHDTVAPASTRTPPTTFTVEATSLPWGHEIGSTLLLPSAGLHYLSQGVVTVFGVPYAVQTLDNDASIPVDVRFDIWDARQVYLVTEWARVHRAAAVAFEHGTSWWDLLHPPHRAAMIRHLV